ncbi:PREDICTED: uncharacterized protein LOC105557431 [Vollenhovia emeryi]|uniref:uncharacterized protein LOC105557431 n=1 Tax=Vollenhovia emeryi TaxID=411798 RepID=UPI0005F4F3DC|nr:PREDICTED: uncharacterized protein LOC105557431 [Vollenhovia emeryi]
MAIKVMQINTNHCRASHDLIMQLMAKGEVGVCCLSEPWRVPASHPHWLPSTDSLAAVKWNPDFIKLTSSVFYRNNNIIGVRFGDLGVISVYISPNSSISDFLTFSDRLSDAIGSAGGPLIICGDFNAKSVLWGSPLTNGRGKILEGLADQHDLDLMNIGNKPTCVRPQGSFHHRPHMGLCLLCQPHPELAHK